MLVGGVWELKIRSARAALVSLLDQHALSLDDELLRTLMVHGSRSYCEFSSTSLCGTRFQTLELTATQLLTLKSNVVMPPLRNFVSEDVDCHKRWRRMQYLAVMT